MEGMLFKPDIWKGKEIALEAYGYFETRRIEKSLEEINKEPGKWQGFEKHGDEWLPVDPDGFAHGDKQLRFKPRYHEGETAYLREKFRVYSYNYFDKWARIEYASDGFISEKLQWNDWLEKNTRYGAGYEGKWRSPYNLPEILARKKLKVIKVSMGRLQDITSEQCELEGIESSVSPDDGDMVQQAIYEMDLLFRFKKLWNTLNKNPLYTWEANPWLPTYLMRSL